MNDNIQSFPASMRVGLVPMSAKPFHKGHYRLIDIASRENDHVIVYVSTSDRRRRGEIPIRGSTMSHIWHAYIEPVLPSNVEVEYGGSPISNVFAQIAEESKRLESGDYDVASYTIYSDDVDIKRFASDKLKKYAPALYLAGKINVRGIARDETQGISGTIVRQFIANGDKESFVDSMPDVFDDATIDAIWNILRNDRSAATTKI